MTTVTADQEHEPTPVKTETRNIRPVIEHALTVYYDGNAELARTLIDQLITEQGAE